jgi:hypothetical protein
MRRTVWLAAFLALSLFPSSAAEAQAEKRVALVVGNGSYRFMAGLHNPANDARLMAQALRESGFALIDGGPQIDLDRPGMVRALRNFGRELGGDAVGLFYYSGHGIQVRDVNYLVPVDADPQRETDADLDLIDVRLVLRQMEEARNWLNMLILDACRNNPLAGRGLRSAGTGLARMEAPAGTLIHFATAPGKLAADGTGANSPYTAALVETMRQPGLGVLDMFNQVGLKVMASTAGAQEPWLASSPFRGQFYFRPPAAAHGPAAAPPPAVAALPPKAEPAVEPIDRPYTAIGAARLRQAPDLNAPVVATLREGETVHVLGKVKGQGWYQVEVKGKPPAYVSAALLSDIPSAKKPDPADPAPPKPQIAAAPPRPRQGLAQFDGVWRGNTYTCVVGTPNPVEVKIVNGRMTGTYERPLGPPRELTGVVDERGRVKGTGVEAQFEGEIKDDRMTGTFEVFNLPLIKQCRSNFHLTRQP